MFSGFSFFPETVSLSVRQTRLSQSPFFSSLHFHPPRNVLFPWLYSPELILALKCHILTSNQYLAEQLKKIMFAPGGR